MKKAFTMIELIFIIVILGILAAIAIPKLAATRDDAELSKAATNISTAVTDLAAFYTSQGNFEDKLSRMTNVQLTDAAGNPAEGLAGYLRVKGKNCAFVQAVKGGASSEADINGNQGSNPAFVYVVTKNTASNADLASMIIYDDKGEIQKLDTATFDPDPICQDFADLPGVKGITQGESSVKMCVNEGTMMKPNYNCGTKFVQGVHLVGGRGVKYEV